MKKIRAIADFFGLVLKCSVPQQRLVMNLYRLSCYGRKRKNPSLLCKMVLRNRRKRRVMSLSTAVSSQSTE